jgi:hypothetical protein
MFRFEQLIRRATIIRGIQRSYLQTIPIFEQLHFRPACDDCSFDTVARKIEFNSPNAMQALSHAASGFQG